MRVNLDLDRDLWRKFKAFAALKGKPMNAHLEDILERELNKFEKKKK